MLRTKSAENAGLDTSQISPAAKPHFARELTVPQKGVRLLSDSNIGHVPVDHEQQALRDRATAYDKQASDKAYLDWVALNRGDNHNQIAEGSSVFTETAEPDPGRPVADTGHEAGRLAARSLHEEMARSHSREHVS